MPTMEPGTLKTCRVERTAPPRSNAGFARRSCFGEGKKERAVRRATTLGGGFGPSSESATCGDLRGLGGLALVAVLQQALHLVHELVDVLELPVDGGEAHVGDLVELLQVLHHELAQLLA